METEIRDWGVDKSDTQRPGVPMERPALARKAPSGIAVRSSALPPRGVSGLIRRAAYRYPEHKPRRWLLLMFADRVDVLEHGYGRYLLLFGVGLAGGAVAAARGLMRPSPRWRAA
jgi:hypothetical protein